MTYNRKNPNFSLSYMFVWVAIISVATACLSASLGGGNGWLVGYRALTLFALGLLLATISIFDPLRRVYAFFFWPFMASVLSICIGFGFIIWYIHSFIPIFLERGIAEPNKIAFRKMCFSKTNLVVIKYDVWELSYWDFPVIGNTAFLTPWRDAYQSGGDHYLNTPGI